MRGGNKLENKLQSLLHLATKNRVSDIHIQPTLTEYEIYFRVPSGLQQISRLTHEEGLRFYHTLNFWPVWILVKDVALSQVPAIL